MKAKKSLATPARRKVCMIVLNDFVRDARVTKEAETLVKEGFEVTVVALFQPKLTNKQENHPSGFKVYRVDRSILRGMPAWLKFREKMKTTSVGKGVAIPFRMVRWSLILGRLLDVCVRERAQVYHAHDLEALPIAWAAAQLTGAKVVYDAHELGTDREPLNPKTRPLKKAMEGWLVKHVDAMITTTDARADFFESQYGIDKPVVLQNRPRFVRLEKNSILRERLGLEKDPRPIVIYQGGIQRGRGLHHIVEAAKEIPEAVFVLIGGGALAGELKRKVEELRVKENVKLIDFVPLDKLLKYTASADIGLQLIQNTCLNHYTTDSNKLFEYIMAGIPVVASDFPEIRKIVTQYDVGLLVDPDRLSDIVEKIKILIHDRELYSKLSQNAKNVGKDLNWENQEHSLIDQVYKPILNYEHLSTKSP